MNLVRFTPRAVLFDLDGTLLDTIDDLAEAVNRTLSELDRPKRSTAEIHSFVGKGLPNLIKRSLIENSHATPEEIAAALPIFQRHYTEVNGDQTRIYPGVLNTLNALTEKNLKLAVVTNKASFFTRALLERMTIAHYFDAVVSGDTLPTRKPEPAMLYHACALLDVKPEEALMVGDSSNDAWAAQAANIPVLLVRYGYSEGQPVETLKCDGLLSNAAELLDWL